MLVTFTTKAWADITMFGEVAEKLIKMMGHSGTVPSAILADDVPAALERLKETIAREAPDSKDEGDGNESDERKVGIATRAYPLIELLTAAAEQNCDVMWHD